MDSDNEIDFRKLVSIQNRKKKRSGAFQSMGLSQAVFRGIIKKGYNIPTPIQRKCIPLIMSGQDVVAMARTGSGKTAAFLIPMFERLQRRSAKTGARALILSPTRELAQQTLKFTKELGKFVNLKSTVILGGNRMEDQFAALHDKPDIIIATPGRFLHVVMEMDLKLNSIEYVVFDEADRLFEMGFAEQLNEILRRLSENRQTLLFSATLPKLMAEFAKAGLNDPTLVRLDVDSKLSEQLKLAFLSCRSEDKIPALIHLLRIVITSNELTVVFVETKHHVEYLATILEEANISSTYLYSTLDQAARKINVTKFQSRKVRVLIVTDLAARGIDIPMLDNVINFSFPPKPKLFVHRVGRVARAGRSGVAYSLITPDEMPYLVDLHLFLGKPIKYCKFEEKIDDWNGQIGSIPNELIDEEAAQIELWHSRNIDLVAMKRVCNNAHKQYLKSRPNPSPESVRRIKEDFQTVKIGKHPIFGSVQIGGSNEAAKLLEQMKSYKPHSTIFEINSTSKTPASALMRQIREKNIKLVDQHQRKIQELNEAKLTLESRGEITSSPQEDKDLDIGFNHVIRDRSSSSKKMFEPKAKKRKMKTETDTEYFVPYKPKNHFSEKGLELEKNAFLNDASTAVLDFTGDEIVSLNRNAKQLKWDRKKKKYLNVSGKETKSKKIKTESGAWIPASYKTDLYKKWQKKSKIEEMENDDSEEEKPNQKFDFNKRKFGNKNKNKRGPKKELKTTEEIMKQRKRKQAIQARQNKRRAEKAKRKSRHKP